LVGSPVSIRCAECEASRTFDANGAASRTLDQPLAGTLYPEDL